MANFALINDSGIVTQVISVNNNYLLDNEVEVEQKGVDYLINVLDIKNMFPKTVLIKQTSYNNSFRGCYAGKGFFYDEINDIFVPPTTEAEDFNF